MHALLAHVIAMQSRLDLPQGYAQLCMMLFMQTQDSAESLCLLLKELYGFMKGRSAIDAETVLPLLLVADKYDIPTVLLRCTVWLNSLDSEKMKGTLLATSPATGERISCL